MNSQCQSDLYIIANVDIWSANIDIGILICHFFIDAILLFQYLVFPLFRYFAATWIFD